MKLFAKSASLMLVGAHFLSTISALEPPYVHKGLGHWRLAGRGDSDIQPTGVDAASAVVPCVSTGCVTAYPEATNLPCIDVNGTTIVAGKDNNEWTMLCDTDFFAQDIFPFILAGSFEECLSHCDEYNHVNGQGKCAGFVFAPDRVNFDNDCYLKSSTDCMIHPSTIHLIGATMVPKPAAGSFASESSSSVAVGDAGSVDEGNNRVPTIKDTKLLGASTNNPTTQYISHAPALPMKLAAKLLQPGINIDLVTKYPLASDTGSWTESSVPFDFELGNITVAPGLSRDGGKGGNINGTHVFYFCDTSTFGDVEGPLGYMNGFVSSSAALDVSKKAVGGDALELRAPIGQWQDDVGRLRGWIPMTTAEEAFNIAVSGDGFRYAVWPESSFITLNQTHSLVYASVVYVEVDMQTQHADFTSLGNTLVVVSVDPVYGPYADRLINQMFTEDEVEWGSLGGVRAWTASGQGSNDGSIYLFGQVEKGVLVAKVAAPDFADRSKYTYWDGSSWSLSMPDKNSTAYLVEQPVMDFDLFYLPGYRTYMMVYLTPYADNTFYFRAMRGVHIIPPYEPNGTADYMEGIVQHPWSEQAVLLRAPVPAAGYIYAGGCHLGYFGDDDVTNGGSKLLLTWTAHTAKDPNNPASGYAHNSAIITFDR